ncbi:hypothetical protein EWN99_16200 [Salmonella enterica]|nr:hypothetical protein [Salmonella enterica]
MSDEKKIEFSTSDVLNALLHRQQNMQHLATQESVDGLRRDMELRFSAAQESVDGLRRDMGIRLDAINQRFDSVEKRVDRLESKFDRLQWFIVCGVLALFFKEYIIKLATAAIHF